MKNKGLAKSVNRNSRGFTMVELMVATAVFLIVGGSAMLLFRQHANLFSGQQSQVGLNISLRSALSQMEQDLSNAGTGYYATADISSWPVGVTVQNQPGGPACHTPGTQVYNAPCFDTINILSPSQAAGVLPGQPPVACSLTSGPIGTPVTMTLTPPLGTTAAQLPGMAAGFSTGSQIIFVHNANNGISAPQMTTALLTSAGTVVGTNVVIHFNPTNANGTNNPTSPLGGPGPNDLLGLTTSPDMDPALLTATLSNQFCGTTDWVVPISVTKYWVDATNPADPQLKRNADVVADQVIGFKVGAALFDTTTLTSGAYNYDTTTYASGATACPSCFDLIRSVRVSVIGRSQPGQVTPGYQNNFDNGPYMIETMSVVINPRNLSMND